MTRLSSWKRDGLLGRLALHSAALLVFIVIVSRLTLAYESNLSDALTAMHPVQAMSILFALLIGYLSIEGGLLFVLVRGLQRAGYVQSGSETRQWIAVVMLIAFFTATIASPLIIGAWGLMLPSLPELAIIIFLPMLMRNR